MPSAALILPNVLSNSSNNTITSCSISSIKLAIPGIYVSTMITGKPTFVASTANVFANNDLPIPLLPDRITPRFFSAFGKALRTFSTLLICTP